MRKEISVCFMALALVVCLGGIARAYPLTAALNSMQVVPQNNSAARGNCRVNVEGDGWGNMWYDLDCQFSGVSGPLIDADIRQAFAGGNGNGICSDKRVTVTLPNAGSGDVTIHCGFNDGGWGPPPATKDKYVVLQTSYFPDGEIRGQIKPAILDADVDGEGRAEVSLFRPSEGVSYSYCNMTNSTIRKELGWNSQLDSTPFLADLDGDGIADWAWIHTIPSSGDMLVYFRTSKNNELWGVQLGKTTYGDTHVFGDYDGDGKIGVADFRPSNGTWYIMNDIENHEIRYDYWGKLGDIPCAGDYDADGKSDLCVIRPENGQFVWYTRRSSDNQPFVVSWGLVTDTIYPRNPVDIDGDGFGDYLVSREENGLRVFYAYSSANNWWTVLQWGLSTDAVKLGDYDNDGKTDFAAIREIDNQLVWFIHQSSDGQMRVEYWGLPGDN